MGENTKKTTTKKQDTKEEYKPTLDTVEFGDTVWKKIFQHLHKDPVPCYDVLRFHSTLRAAQRLLLYGNADGSGTRNVSLYKLLNAKLIILANKIQQYNSSETNPYPYDFWTSYWNMLFPKPTTVQKIWERGTPDGLHDEATRKAFCSPFQTDDFFVQCRERAISVRGLQDDFMYRSQPWWPTLTQAFSFEVSSDNSFTHGFGSVMPKILYPGSFPNVLHDRAGLIVGASSIEDRNVIQHYSTSGRGLFGACNTSMLKLYKPGLRGPKNWTFPSQEVEPMYQYPYPFQFTYPFFLKTPSLYDQEEEEELQKKLEKNKKPQKTTTTTTTVPTSNNIEEVVPAYLEDKQKSSKIPQMFQNHIGKEDYSFHLCESVVEVEILLKLRELLAPYIRMSMVSKSFQKLIFTSTFMDSVWTEAVEYIHGMTLESPSRFKYAESVMYEPDSPNYNSASSASKNTTTTTTSPYKSYTQKREEYEVLLASVSGANDGTTESCSKFTASNDSVKLLKESESLKDVHLYDTTSIYKSSEFSDEVNMMLEEYNNVAHSLCSPFAFFKPEDLLSAATPKSSTTPTPPSSCHIDTTVEEDYLLAILDKHPTAILPAQRMLALAPYSFRNFLSSFTDRISITQPDIFLQRDIKSATNVNMDLYGWNVESNKDRTKAACQMYHDLEKEYHAQKRINPKTGRSFYYNKLQNLSTMTRRSIVMTFLKFPFFVNTIPPWIIEEKSLFKHFNLINRFRQSNDCITWDQWMQGPIKHSCGDNEKLKTSLSAIPNWRTYGELQNHSIKKKLEKEIKMREEMERDEVDEEVVSPSPSSSSSSSSSSRNLDFSSLYSLKHQDIKIDIDQMVAKADIFPNALDMDDMTNSFELYKLAHLYKYASSSLYTDYYSYSGFLNQYFSPFLGFVVNTLVFIEASSSLVSKNIDPVISNLSTLSDTFSAHVNVQFNDKIAPFRKIKKYFETISTSQRAAEFVLKSFGYAEDYLEKRNNFRRSLLLEQEQEEELRAIEKTDIGWMRADENIMINDDDEEEEDGRKTKTTTTKVEKTTTTTTTSQLQKNKKTKKQPPSALASGKKFVKRKIQEETFRDDEPDEAGLGPPKKKFRTTNKSQTVSSKNILDFELVLPTSTWKQD